MIWLFPQIHSVPSAIVMHPRAAKDISYTFDMNEVNQGCDIDKIVDSTGGNKTGNDDCDTADGDVIDLLSLTKRERAVLEFFIAQIQLRRQHWAMAHPLASYCRGHLNSPSHPLHSSGCSTVTLWGHLNELFHSTTNSRRDILKNQYTNGSCYG
jgi:hypothetical protein